MGFSFAGLENVKWVEAIYAQYLKDPKTVDSSWRYFFEGMSFAQSLPSESAESADLRVHLLIHAYRSFGHLMAHCNPIATSAPEEPQELKLESWGFSESDLTKPFPTCGFLNEPQAPLQQLIEALRRTYCGSIGVEYVGLGNTEIEKWLQQEIEPEFPIRLDTEERINILHFLNKAELFETFLHTKYVGQKRFSLEGGETLIPMLDTLIEKGAEIGVEEAVIGMPHRGRLNVLVNILNKSYAQIFKEFEDHYMPDEAEGTGDVKYHKGFTGVLLTHTGKGIPITLVANPSHLESVDPVVEGIVRAKQEIKRKAENIVPLLIHGDAAVAGQGVVYETLQLCKLRGYGTGGTIHLIVNNQIGFTTLPKDARSTHYCTEIGRAFGAPIFHVNSEDPEGCVRVAKLAIEMRERFKCDIFIDFNCYRKYGHNEGDEPAFTQPLEYTIINSKRSVREIYRDKLIAENILTPEQAGAFEEEFKNALQQALETVSSNPPQNKNSKSETSASEITTAVSKEVLITLAQHFCHVPENFTLHPKVKRLFEQRLSMMNGDPNTPTIDWGMGEHLGLATLLQDGIHIRVSGQDSRRGTFSHRHAIVVDQTKEQKYFPLSHLSSTQAPFDIFNSPLSEYGVLGFEFGYSIAYPRSLVIWEAQYGDFANGAQIIIDQYIATSEQKWNLATNLTLMLPHGYEGAGPEHSSARIERFLQLSAHDNMRIVNCTTPAQLFHILRMQGLSKIKKPLILFTPKAILRHPKNVSSLNEFTQGKFQEVIEDSTLPSAKRVIFCTGKIYYDLIEEREKKGKQDCAIIRIEELHPFPKEQIAKILKQCSSKEIIWAQEEHSNMGAWDYIQPFFNELLGVKSPLQYIGRERSAAPAVGSYALHKRQLTEILTKAFP